MSGVTEGVCHLCAAPLHDAPVVETLETPASALDGLVAADPTEPLSVAELRHLRRQILDYIGHVRRMADGYDKSADAIGKLGNVLTEDGAKRLESWHEDPYVHGFEMGRGHGLQRAGFACHHLANAMRMLESSDEERSGT